MHRAKTDPNAYARVRAHYARAYAHAHNARAYARVRVGGSFAGKSA